MALQSKVVKLIGLVSLVLPTLLLSGFEAGASGSVPQTWWVSTDPTMTEVFGEGASCTSPDLVVDTSVNSAQISTLFDDHVLDGETVIFCPGTYYISETIVIDNNREVIVAGPDPSSGSFFDSVILDGKDSTQIMRVVDGASLTLVGFVMRNGSATQTTVSDDCVTSAACGGALGILTSGTVLVNGMEFSGNEAAQFGGAIAISGGPGLSFPQQSSVTIRQSLFRLNTAGSGGAIGSLAHNVLPTDPSKSYVASNTFYNNSSTLGGEVINSSDSFVSLRNNTVVQSSWSNQGLIAGMMGVSSNILAVEADSTSAPSGSITCGESVIDIGGNLALDDSCGFSQEITTWNPNSGLSYVLPNFEDFGLTQLRTFGDGITPMFGIFQWSAAIGTGSSFDDCDPVDQRGAVRMAASDSIPGSDLNCDVGAFERLIGWVEPTYVNGGGPSGSGSLADPYEIPIGEAIELDLPNQMSFELVGPTLGEIEQVTDPYTSWSIGARLLVANVINQAGFSDPYVFVIEYVLPFDHVWNNCITTLDYFCVESATIVESGISLRDTNDLNVQFNVQFLDGGNGVTSFNWSVGTWNVGASTDLPDEMEDLTVSAVIRTGGFVPRMTTSYSKNLRVDVAENGGMNTLTITASPTEVNTLTGADPGYTLCASSGVCGDESTQASYNALVLSGNSQDLHTWGSDADTFAGFYSAQNAQYGPTISILALQFRVYPEAYWELTLANPHLAVSGEVATGHMNAWMPSAYFESMGTTTSAALSVGFTVMSEETTDEGTITQVVPAQLSEVNGGLMVTLDSVSYSTNKIRVYNRADTGIQVSSAGGADGSSSNQSTLDFVFRLDRTVTGVSVADFEIAETSTTTGCEISAVEVQGVDIHVSVANCGSSGEVAVRLKADSLSFGGNLGPVEAVVSSSVTIDTIRPGVVRFNSSERSPSKKTSLQYVIEFDESVEGLSAGDFVNAGTATGCVFTPNSSSGTLFTITITGCSNMGTLKPRLITSGVIDSAGNSPLNDWLQTSVVIKLDRVAPQLIFKAVTAKSTKLRTLTFMVAAKSRTEELNCSTITASDFVITKGSFVSTRTQGSKCLVTVRSTVAALQSGTTQLARSRRISISDTAGNVHSSLAGLSLNWTMLRGNP